MLTSGTRVKVNNEYGKEYGECGIVITDNKEYAPNVAVLLDKYSHLVPELAIRYFWSSELQEIK